MGSDAITRIAEAWAGIWSVALAAGYLAEATPWRWMKALRERAVLRHMLMATAAVVVGFALAGVRDEGFLLAAWAAVSASVKLLCDTLTQVD